MLFKYLVQSVLSYGVEIWGWAEKKELEKIMLDYVRWVYRLDFCTPRYLMSRELGLKKLRIGWGLRAMKFEEKIRAEKEDRWLNKCWLDKDKNNWEDMYSNERELYYNRNGWGVQAIEGIRAAGGDIKSELVHRDWEVQRQMEKNRLMETNIMKDIRSSI